VSMLANKSQLQVFSLMFGTCYWLQIGGQLYIAEIILLFVALSKFFGIGWKQVKINSNVSRFFKLLVLAIFGQIVSDLVRGSSGIVALKGFALLFFTLTNLYALSILIDGSIQKAYFAYAGYSCGLVVGVFLQPSIFIAEYPWKFGFGPPLTSLFLLWVAIKFKSISTLRVMTGAVLLSGLDLAYSARSLSAWTIVSVAVALLARIKLRASTEKSPIKSMQSRNIFLIATVGLFFFTTYAVLASSGFLGSDAELKYKLQSSSNLGLLISGRAELVSEAVAISRSPIIGYGSYPPLNDEIRMASLDILQRNNIKSPVDKLFYGENYSIQVHSQIFQFWIWFGILGVFFFWFMVPVFIKALRAKKLNPFIAFLCIQGLWDIFFSPYAADRRIQVPLAIICVSIFLNKSRIDPALKQD